MTVGIIVFVLGALLLFISAFVRKVAKRAKHLSNQPKFSQSVKEAGLVSGIYFEHGMVDDQDGVSVNPQMKHSGAYYESLID